MLPLHFMCNKKKKITLSWFHIEIYSDKGQSKSARNNKQIHVNTQSPQEIAFSGAVASPYDEPGQGTPNIDNKLRLEREPEKARPLVFLSKCFFLLFFLLLVMITEVITES